MDTKDNSQKIEVLMPIEFSKAEIDIILRCLKRAEPSFRFNRDSKHGELLTIINGFENSMQIIEYTEGKR